MADASVDLGRAGQRIHVIGIGGAGMSAIATVLAAMGHRVSGSDLKPSSALERLSALGVDVQVGHDAAQVADAEVVTFSTAIPERNPELAAARERDLPVLRRADMLAAITATRRTVAVAGTHGKTTTSSMLALILTEAGMHPSYIVGGELNETGQGAVWGTGDLLVVEADESDGTFLELGAEAVIVTNVEPDHLDHYGSWEALQEAFRTFTAAATGPRVVCADDAEASALARAYDATTYGTDDAADYRMQDVTLGRSSSSFTVVQGGKTLAEVSVPVAGLHNARNACAALAMAHELGAPVDAAVSALARYAGVARRFQFRGERDGVTFVDDYAHLPGEISSALAAARNGDWRRVVCVFQPHRYTRTSSLWRTFADAFVDADLLVVTEIYAAGETPLPGVSGKLVLDAVLEAHPSQRVAFMPGRHDVVSYLRSVLRPGDLCLTLGAGDLTTLPDEMLA